MKKINVGHTTGVLANVAEVVSAIAVVISLLYVGYQIKQNTEETRTANRQQLIGRAVNATLTLQDPERSRVVTKLRAGEPLSEVEKTQVGYIVRAVIYDVQEAYLLHLEGGLDEGYWSTRAAIILAYLNSPVTREIYRQDKAIGAVHPDFVEWLDAALEEKYGD